MKTVEMRISLKVDKFIADLDCWKTEVLSWKVTNTKIGRVVICWNQVLT